MTYEEQRALRNGQQRSAASRYSVENYGSDRYSSTARTRPSARSSSGNRASRYSRQDDPTRSATERRQSVSGREPSPRRSTTARRSTTPRRTTAQGAQRSSRGQGRQSYAQPSNRAGQAQGALPGQGVVSQLVSGPLVFKIAAAAILLVAVVLLVQLCSAVSPITVTVNGSQYELRGDKTVQTAIKESGLPINPGDLISLNGTVLEKSAGHPFAATINDQQTVDPRYKLRNGDMVTISDGEDIVEEYDATEQSVPFASSIVGSGAIHKFTDGTNGVMETRVGKVSGETVEKETVAPVDATCTMYNLNVGNDKVVAFTFDDGPNNEYTPAILDILKENGAKGTFFCIGTNVEEYPDMVKRIHEEGHQLCTHSYDHAEPAGGTNLSFMDAAGQLDEIEHGQRTITDIVGGDASHVVRFPGGNFDEAMVINLQSCVDYDIGWNVDTQDWTLPGAEAIYNSMISVKPGEVLLCHDGGGDRSQTVEALGRALPYLKSQGFTFVTMDELLEYPSASA